MKIKRIYLVALIFVLFCIFAFFNSFEKIENLLQDSVLQTQGKADTRIVILGIDEESLSKLGQWQWPRNYIADAVNLLSKGKAAAIGLDIIYSEPARNPEEDKALVKAVKEAGNVVIPVFGDFGNEYVRAHRVKVDVLKEPFRELKDVSASGHINAVPDQSDSIVRNFMVSFGYRNENIISFDEQIYRIYMKNTGKPVRDDLNIPVNQYNRTLITFTGEPMYYEHLPISKLLSGEIPPDYFQDKIVLIGPYAAGLGDFYFTPLNHSLQMMGVEIHANIIQQFLYNNFKRYVPDWIYLLILLLLSIAGYFAFRRFTPAISAVITAGFVAAYIAAAVFLFKSGYILQIFYPIALVIINYLIMLGYRYIEEYLERKRITGVFGRYVAPQVVNQILSGGEAGLKLGGTRRFISVLFVDIRGFTPLSEKLQPEQIVEILNEYLNLTASSIFKFGGTLDKFIGDATMAIFNAPLDLEDHPFMAVQTAWAMKQGADALAQGLLEKFGKTVQFGIGVNTGYAVVGNIGAHFRMDYTAIGDTVNTSARLEANAKPGQILISQATYDLVKDKVEVTSLGGIKVKGKEAEIPIYQLEGIKPEFATKPAEIKIS